MIARYRKKGIPAVLLSVLLVLAAGACTLISNAESGRENGSLAHTDDADTDAENASDGYLAILTGNKQFMYYADGSDTAKPMDITDILDVFSPDSSYAQIYEFAVLDFDGNGENEVLLKVYGVSGDSGGYMLLRLENGEVHGYTGNYKTFSDLKTDGTFTYTSLATPDAGIGTVRFHQNGYRIVPLASSETAEILEPQTGTFISYDLDNVTYQADHRPVSEDEYLAVMEQQKTKTDADWYRFTEENIRAQFSASSQKE